MRLFKLSWINFTRLELVTFIGLFCQIFSSGFVEFVIAAQMGVFNIILFEDFDVVITGFVEFIVHEQMGDEVSSADRNRRIDAFSSLALCPREIRKQRGL
jgi:hypothetical protein